MVELKASELMESIGIEIKVIGLRWALFRVYLARPLFWLAARIAGLGDVQITELEEDEESDAEA